MKWQRQLVQALLSATKKRNIQFILATHSFEILAQHRANVLALKSETDDGHRPAAHLAGASHAS